MTTIDLATLADDIGGTKNRSATITARATRPRSAGKNLTVPDTVTLKVRNGEPLEPFVLEEPDGTWAWEISVLPLGWNKRDAITGIYSFSGDTVAWGDMTPVDPRTLAPLEPMPPNVIQILAEAEQAVTSAETAAQNSASAQASAAGFASAAQGYAAQVIPMADAAVQSAVAEIVVGENAAPAEQLGTDEFTVRFDDGDPFFQANESLGIHNTKIAGNEHVDIEETVKEPGWQFCYYRRDSFGRLFRLFGLRDDGTFYPSTLGLDRSGPGIAHFGDSLTAGAGGGGVTTVGTIGTLTGLPVFNGGIGGERSPDIAMRQGGNPLFLDFSGTFPASTAATTVGVYRRNGAAASTPIKQGTAAVNPVTVTLPSGVRVQGTLTWDGTNSVYKFARLTAGTALAVNRRLPVLGAGSAYRSWIQLLQPGRNNAAELAQIQEDTVSMIESLTPGRKRFLVLGILNGDGESPGTSSHSAIVAHTDWAFTKFGRRFVDIRRYLIDYGLADAKSLGLLPSNFTPTATDTANIAADIVPQTLRSDNLHLTGVGYTVVGRYVHERLLEMGWL